MPTFSAILALFLYTSGCGFIQLDRGINEFRLRSTQLEVLETNAGHDATERRPFVGLAISGGGSRSANFGAAVMQELDRIGILEHVTAISSVSGGALPAAYYVLHHKRQDWSWDTLKELMATNFYSKFLWRHLNPWGLLNYVATEYNRSDMMSDVFDASLFDGATFGDIATESPQLLINATVLRTSADWQWTFTEKTFREINSRLDTYSIARAVAATTAVPGIFHSVALATYRDGGAGPYMHLVDGGVSENLGLLTLLRTYNDSQEKPSTTADMITPIRKCLIIAVDSFPGRLQADPHTAERDTRTAIDFIIDRNMLGAIDIMSANARERFFIEHGRPVEAEEQVIFTQTFSGYHKRSFCQVWHIHFGHLIDSQSFYPRDGTDGYAYQKLRTDLHDILPAIDTHWKLVVSGTCGSEALQDALYAGAKILVRDDHLVLNIVKRWFQDNGLKLNDSVPEGKEESSDKIYRKWNMRVVRFTNDHRVLCDTEQEAAGHN